AFEESYERLYGHRQPESVAEIVKLRLVGIGRLPLPPPVRLPRATAPARPAETRSVWIDERHGRRAAPVYAGPDLAPGHRLDGPLVVEELTTTIVVGAGDVLEVDDAGNYLVHIDAKGAA
ncbi:MAG: hypothetical protein AB7F67_11845, partial [Rhodospirillaceae bacterium]